MENLRKEWFWHPQFGVLDVAAINLETEDTFRKSDGSIVIVPDDYIETVYQRDRRLWVEQAMSMELVNQNTLLTDTQIEHRTKYYFKAYDLIQNVIFQNQ